MALYAIAGGGFIKVGFTSGPPADRLGALQVGNPHGLELIGIADGSPADEKAVHGLLAAFWVRGEWFADCQGSRALLALHVPRVCPTCGHDVAPRDRRYTVRSAAAIGSEGPTSVGAAPAERLEMGA